MRTIVQINSEVTAQEKEYYAIFNNMILPELKRNGIVLYQTDEVEPFHRAYVEKYFNEEVFPYLQPMVIMKDDIHSFIQDGRIYQVISLLKKRKKKDADGLSYTYAIMKIPYTKIPRFIELPVNGGNYYIMFIDDVIKANMQSVFPGYEIVDCFTSRYRAMPTSHWRMRIRKILPKKSAQGTERKIGAVTRFQYDKDMPDYFLRYLCEAYEIEEEELLPSGRYLNLADLASLPNPVGDSLKQKLPQPLRVPELESNTSILRVLRKQDVLLHFPYQSFDYLLRFLMQAAFDPKVIEIKVTQYRVAENRP